MDNNNHQDRRRNGQYYREGQSERPYRAGAAGNENAQYRGSRPGDENAQYRGSMPGNENAQYRGSRSGNENAQYRGSRPGNENAQYRRSMPGNENAQYRGSMPGNENVQYRGSRPGNENAQYHRNPQANYGGNGSGGGRKDNRKKKKRGIVGDIVSGLLMVIALAVFLYSGYTLYGFYKDYKAGTDEYESLEIYAVNDEGEETENLAALEQLQQETAEEMTEPETTVIEENGQQIRVPVMSSPVDFEELEKVNEDIVGWLKVRAIDISYPIVQGEDNDFYLHRTFEKVDNFAGCIFMNSDNKADYTDQNTIIYGHNMKNGSMFGKLKNFQEAETYDKSEYFWIYTPDRIYQYHIFSAMTVNKTGLTYQTFFMPDEFQSLINMAFSNSTVDNSHIEMKEDDRIVTLSTCTGNDATRFVVMGRLAQVYAVRK